MFSACYTEVTLSEKNNQTHQKSFQQLNLSHKDKNKSIITFVLFYRFSSKEFAIALFKGSEPSVILEYYDKFYEQQ